MIVILYAEVAHVEPIRMHCVSLGFVQIHDRVEKGGPKSPAHIVCHRVATVFLPIRTVRRGFVGLFQPRNIRKPSGPLPAKSIRHGLSKSLDHFDVLGKKQNRHSRKPFVETVDFYDLLWKNFVSFRCSYIFSLFLWRATCKSKKTPITT